MEMEEEEEEPREKSEPAPPNSGLYSATVMLSLNVTECGVWDSWLLLRRDDSEWTPFRALNDSVIYPYFSRKNPQYVLTSVALWSPE